MSDHSGKISSKSMKRSVHPSAMDLWELTANIVKYDMAINENDCIYFNSKILDSYPKKPHSLNCIRFIIQKNAYCPKFEYDTNMRNIFTSMINDVYKIINHGWKDYGGYCPNLIADIHFYPMRSIKCNKGEIKFLSRLSPRNNNYNEDSTILLDENNQTYPLSDDKTLYCYAFLYLKNMDYDRISRRRGELMMWANLENVKIPLQ